MRLTSKIIKALLIVAEIIRSRLFSRRKMKILFSNKRPEWEREISWGFRFTRHEIAFRELTPQNINDSDLVVPLTVNELNWLSEQRHLISENLIPIQSRESLELCDDKYLFNHRLIENGYADLIPEMGESLPYPYILKKRQDGFAKHSYLIADAEQAQGYSEFLNHPEYFCQKFIPGSNEFATHILIKNQKIVRSINIEYVFRDEFPIKGKVKPDYT